MPTPEKLLQLDLPILSVAETHILLIGVTPLIVHRWSIKAREMILAKQTKKVQNKRELRDPDADYRESLYMMEYAPDALKDKYQIETIQGKMFIPCFPSIGFKNSAVTACTSITGITKISARQCFHVIGENIPIQGRHRMREDMVRIGMGTADLRYRAEFPQWQADVKISYNTNVLSLAQLNNLFQTAGFAVGIGEFRPERNGPYGRFEIKQQA